jgi:hypothetical protein
MSMLVFWVVTPCGLVRGHQHFGGTYCLHLQHFGMFLRNVGIYLQVHTVLRPRKPTSTSAWPDEQISILKKNPALWGELLSHLDKLAGC